MGSIAVLFGAGASKGCTATSPRPPPLGSELFVALCREFPLSWGRLPDGVRRSFTSNFEVGMGELLASGAMSTNYLMREFATFFSRFHPTDATSYDEFLLELEQKGALNRTKLITLNYECLLEYAVAKRGRRVVYFERDAPSEEEMTVWKPHGSCNFIPRGLAVQGVVIDPRIGVDGGSIEPAQPHVVESWCKSGTSLYPAMALYAKGKPTMMTSSALQQIQGWTADALRGATAVAVVGVLPNPEDPHLWQPLAENRGSMYFVGSKLAFESWRASHGANVVAEFVGSRFEHCAQDLASRLATHVHEVENA